MDHGTSKWEPSLVDIAWAMNRTYVESIGCTPWELVFRNKMCPLHQLDVNERKEILGVPCEEGGFLTEASLQEGNPVEPTEEVTDRFMALDRKKDTALRSTPAVSSDPSIGIAGPVSQQDLPI
jgi:hypothetical protein